MADSFFYSIIDSNQCLLSHKSYENIRFSDDSSIEPILKDELLLKDYDHISILSLMDECLFLPIIDDTLAANMPAFENKRIKVEKFLGNDVYTYFALSPHQESLLQHVFGEKLYEIHHISNAFMSHYIAKYQNVIHGHIEQNHIHIFHLNAGEFKFYRSFNTQGIKDVLYFIAAIYEGHGLDMSKEELVLSGWVEEDSPLFKLIKSYVGKVTIQDSLTFTISERCDPLTKPHFYFAHHINSLCVS